MNLEFHYARENWTAADREFGDRNGKLEPARAGAAGVDVEYATTPLHRWFVGMP